jgi:hypothetical protein
VNSGILQPNTPIKFEARNPRPAFRRLKTGDIYTINLEVDEETWASLKTMPDNAIIELVGWFHDGDGQTDAQPEEKPKKEKAPKGEYGPYWAAMFRAGFNANRDLIGVLNCSEAGEVKDALKAYFEVQSLTMIAPPVFEQFCAHYVMHGLVTLSRQCAAKVQENA